MLMEPCRSALADPAAGSPDSEVANPASGSSRELSSSGGEPEGSRVRGGPVRVTGRERALAADERDEFRHRRAEAAALVRLVDVRARGQHRLAVRQFPGGRRLARHERPDLRLATSAAALTAPPLPAKMFAGPASSAPISRHRSSACSSGVVSAEPSVILAQHAIRPDRYGG